MKKVFYLFSKAFFWAFSLFSAFVLLFSIMSFLEYYFNWDIPFIKFFVIEEQNYVTIQIPLIKMKVQFLFSFTMLLMWGTFIFYSIYFYALQNFFAVFIAKKTFEESSLKKLNLFYRLNYIPVIVSVIGIVIELFIEQKLIFNEVHFFFILHLLIIFLLYLYLDLVRKGLKIQQENDLTI